MTNLQRLVQGRQSRKVEQFMDLERREGEVIGVAGNLHEQWMSYRHGAWPRPPLFAVAAPRSLGVLEDDRRQSKYGNIEGAVRLNFLPCVCTWIKDAHQSVTERSHIAWKISGK